MTQQIHQTNANPPATGGFNGKRIWQNMTTGDLFVWKANKYEALPTSTGGGSTQDPRLENPVSRTLMIGSATNTVAPLSDGTGILGTVLTSQGPGQEPQWLPPAGGGGGSSQLTATELPNFADVENTTVTTLVPATSVPAKAIGAKDQPIISAYRGRDLTSGVNTASNFWRKVNNSPDELYDGFIAIGPNNTTLHVQEVWSPSDNAAYYVLSIYKWDVNQPNPLLRRYQIVPVTQLAALLGIAAFNNETSGKLFLFTTSLEDNSLIVSTFNIPTDVGVNGNEVTYTQSYSYNGVGFNDNGVWGRSCIYAQDYNDIGGPQQDLYIAFGNDDQGSISLVKLNPTNGLVLWATRYTTTNSTQALESMQVTYQGILLLTEKEVIAVSSVDGSILWSASYSSPQTSSFKLKNASANQLSIDQFLGAVVTLSAGNVSGVPAVIRIAPDTGNVTWSRSYNMAAVGAGLNGNSIVLGDGRSFVTGSQSRFATVHFDYTTGAPTADGSYFRITTPNVAAQLQFPLTTGASLSSLSLSESRYSVVLTDSRIAPPVQHSLLMQYDNNSRQSGTFSLQSSGSDISFSLTASATVPNIVSSSLNVVRGAGTYSVNPTPATLTRNFVAADVQVSTTLSVSSSLALLPGPVTRRAMQGINGYGLDIAIPHPYNPTEEGTGYSETTHHFLVVKETGAWHLGVPGVDTLEKLGGKVGQVLASTGPTSPPIWRDNAGTKYIELSVGREDAPLGENVANAYQTDQQYGAMPFDVVASPNASVTGSIPDVTFNTISAGSWQGGTNFVLPLDGVYAASWDVIMDIGFLADNHLTGTPEVTNRIVDFGFGLWLPGENPLTAQPIVWIPANKRAFTGKRQRFSASTVMRLSASTYVLAFGYWGLSSPSQVPGGKTQSTFVKRTFRLAMFGQ